MTRIGNQIWWIWPRSDSLSFLSWFLNAPGTTYLLLNFTELGWGSNFGDGIQKLRHLGIFFLDHLKQETGLVLFAEARVLRWNFIPDLLSFLYCHSILLSSLQNISVFLNSAVGKPEVLLVVDPLAAPSLLLFLLFLLRALFSRGEFFLLGGVFVILVIFGLYNIINQISMFESG